MTAGFSTTFDREEEKKQSQSFEGKLPSNSMPKQEVMHVGRQSKNIHKFFCGNFHGQRRLASYSLWGHTESNVAYRLSTRANVINSPRKNRNNSEWLVSTSYMLGFECFTQFSCLYKVGTIRTYLKKQTNKEVEYREMK